MPGLFVRVVVGMVAGNFGIETTAERLLCRGVAQCGGECARVEDFRSIESGEWIAQNWHAVLGGDAERGNGIGEPRRRIRAQATHLKNLHSFEEDLREGLGLTSLYNESLGTTTDLHMYDRVEHRDEGDVRRPWEDRSAG